MLSLGDENPVPQSATTWPPLMACRYQMLLTLNRSGPPAVV